MSRIIFLISIFVFFIVLPFFNLTLAAEPCLSTETSTGRNIDYYPVDASGNRIYHIPDGVTEVKIKISNLGSGWYRLEFPKGGPPAISDANSPSADNALILTISDADKLKNGTHIGNLQRAESDDWNPITRNYNEQFCRDVHYTVGYPRESCTMRVIPTTPTDKQKFMLEVHSAPMGDFFIVESALNPVLANRNPVKGSVTIGPDGRGVSLLLGCNRPGEPNCWNIGNYPIYLAPFIAGSGAIGTVTDASKQMCNKTLKVISDLSTEPTPSCALLVSKRGTDTDFNLKAFNLKSGTDYGIYLDSDGNAVKKADKNSGGGEFDYTLITNPKEGRYIASLKDANEKGCDIAFSVDSTGNLVPDSVTSTKICKPGDPSCTNSGSTVCTPIGSTKEGIKTQLGCIPTEPKDFVATVLRFTLGIGGGLAFLMMLLGAFQMITSAGNPDTLNAARERMTSAIIGLLMIIFAVLLLQIIGVGILNIPGFT